MWFKSEVDWTNFITSCNLCPGKNTKKKSLPSHCWQHKPEIPHTNSGLQAAGVNTHTHTHTTLYHHWPPSPVSSGLSTTQQLKFPQEKVTQVTAKYCFSIGIEQRTRSELLTLSFSIYPKMSVSLKLIESSTVWSMKRVNPDLGQSLKNTMYSISISYPAANQEPWKCFWTEGRYHHI